MADMKIERDAVVRTADGTLGKVHHVIVDPMTKEVTDLVVGDNGENRGEIIVPMSAVTSVDSDQIVLRGNHAAFGAGSRFDRSHYHPVDADDARDESQHTARRGGAPLIDAGHDEVEIAGAGRGVIEGRGGTSVGQAYRLQLREEHLLARKERVQAGQVTIGKQVTERTERMSVPVSEERVVIARRPGDGRAASGEICEGEFIDVPVMKERVRVEKETVVNEEIGVRKETVQRTQQVQGTVRKEELDMRDRGGLVREGDRR
jgi:uncharacterized protein (TIGR02271 family)